MSTENKKYPVFEENQMLSNNHLNGLVSYLDNEERDTRNLLLALGVAYGLKVLPESNSNNIRISPGYAVTSEGYLIQYEGGLFTHYQDAEVSEDFLGFIEGRDYEHNYENLQSAHRLQKSDELDSNSLPLNESILTGKIILLLLEAQLIDQKNCTSISCDDKGMRMEFRVKPIIVDPSWLTSFHEMQTYRPHFKKLYAPRFDVPRNHLITGNDLFEAFENSITSSGIIDKASAGIASLYNYYKNSIDPDTKMNSLQNIKPILQAFYNRYKGSMYMQYLYDWLKDIGRAYNEILDHIQLYMDIFTVKDEVFPFHISLGLATLSTEECYRDRSDYPSYLLRQDAIELGFLSLEKSVEWKKFNLMFRRLFLIVNNFKVDPSLQISITPTDYGHLALGGKSIPFYYDRETIADLSEVWNPELSLALRQDELLSYHSSSYSAVMEVNNPLKYDIEKYHSFEIAGHIGKETTSAVSKIKSLQEQYRLPFQVVLLNAVDDTGKDILYENQIFDQDDLELQYDLARTELDNICQNVLNWIDANKGKIKEVLKLNDDSFFTSAHDIFDEFNLLLTDDLPAFLQNYSTFSQAFTELTNLFLYYSTRVDNAQANNCSIETLNELEDRLDEYQAFVFKDPFIIIFKESERRYKNAVRETFLKNFFDKHSAIEHIGGATVGSTLVLVQSDYEKLRTDSPPPLTPVWTETFGVLKNFAGLSVAEISRAEKKNIMLASPAYKMYRAPDIVNNPCAEQQRSVNEGMKRNFIDVVSSKLDIDYAKYVWGTLDTNIFHLPNVPNPPADSTPQKVIIADFFLPYICCAKGDSINIVIENPPSDIENPTEVGDFYYPDMDPEDFDTPPISE